MTSKLVFAAAFLGVVLVPLPALARDVDPKDPGAPESVAAKVITGWGDTPEGVEVSWKQPLLDGGSPIRNYDVYRIKDDGTMYIVGVTSNLSLVDHGDMRNGDLRIGEVRRYQVSALNDYPHRGPLSSVVAVTVVPFVRMEPLTAEQYAALTHPTFYLDSDGLDVTVVAADGGPAWYFWDFGDGAPATGVFGGVSRSHHFDEPGIYAVRLQTVDRNGVELGQAFRPVTAQAQPAPLTLNWIDLHSGGLTVILSVFALIVSAGALYVSHRTAQAQRRKPTSSPAEQPAERED